MMATAKRRIKTANISTSVLLAMPGMADDRFARKCCLSLRAFRRRRDEDRHQPPRPSLNFFPKLPSSSLRITQAGRNNPIAHAQAGTVPVFAAVGPVEAGRGFVLHSNDFYDRQFDAADRRWRVADRDWSIYCARLRMGSGPDRAILALGYAGWSPGQLEDEMQNNGWLSTCLADASLIFDTPPRRPLRGRDAQDRHRSRLPFSRRRPSPPRRPAACAAPTSLRASAALIGWPKTKPCANSHPS